MQRACLFLNSVSVLKCNRVSRVPLSLGVIHEEIRGSGALVWQG